MQKELVIQFHCLFAQLKEELERVFPKISDFFGDYEAHGVLPQHVHKSKSDHIKACCILGEKIAELFSYDKYAGTGRTAERLALLAKKLS